jgi:hypothetical protein
MLIQFGPATLCNLQKDLLLAPLPASKQLWEAGDEYVWKAERERGPRTQISFGLTASGELVELEPNQIYGRDDVLLYRSLDGKSPSRSAAHWEEWCSGMDGFGSIVMLAASLIV